MLKQALIASLAIFLTTGFGGKNVPALSYGRATDTAFFPPTVQTEERININTASVEELKRLPGVGQKLAERVIAHRAKHGAFKRPQDIVIVRGFSAKRYRQIAHLIRT